MAAGLGPDAPARAIVEGSTQPGARGHTRLPSASRLTETPGHCMRSEQSGQQVLYAPPHEFGLSTKLYSRLHLPRAVRIGRREICLHSSLRQEARIGISADVASGRCVQLRLCHTPFPCALQDNEIDCESY